MIVSRIYGGMGNQMFQYAFGRRLSLKYNTLFKIYFDDFGPGWADHSRQLTLTKFNIQAEIATTEDRARFICDSRNKIIRLIHKAGRMIQNLHYVGDGARVHELHYDALNAPDNSYTDGFWQSEIYFHDIAETIRQDFSLREALTPRAKQLENAIVGSNAVCMHVRRGDYLQQTATYHIAGMDYYNRAFEIIKSKVRDPVIYAFSNDPAWVRENFKFDVPVVVVEGTHAHEDMYLMSRCLHNVSSNSTFGWWGAWLNRNPDKVVILPARWLTDISIDTSHYTAAGWLRV